MTTIVRHCTSCGRDDLSRRWSSRDAAADDGALRGAWACPNCAWTEAELAEPAPADASASMSTKPLSGSAQPQSEDRDPALDTGDPEMPVDPDEMRRSVETEARILR